MRELDRFASRTGRRVGEVIKQRSGHVARELAYVTGPRGLNHTTKKRIENSIRGDLLGRYNGGQPGIFYSAPLALLRKWYNISPTGMVRTWATKDGRVYGTESDLYRPNASMAEMESHHRRYFKNGRMTKAGHFTRDIGRWKFIDKMVVGKTAAAAYLRRVLQRVGWSKAGWITAALHVGGRVPAGGRLRVPMWVLRHARKAPGRGVDHTAHRVHPYILLMSRVPWVTEQVTASGVAAALRGVRVNLEKELRMRLAAESRRLRLRF